MDKLKIDREKVIDLYLESSQEQQKVLEKLFGLETFYPHGIMDSIRTFDDAWKALGPNHPLVKEYEAICKADVTQRLISYSKLFIVTAALNEGWVPEFKEKEHRYFPQFFAYSDEEVNKMSEEQMSRVAIRYSSYADVSCGLFCASGGCVISATIVGSRLVFKTRELAEYAGKQFLSLYADYLFSE